MLDPTFDKIKTVDPSTWPQYPFDEDPARPESSAPSYEIHDDTDVMIPMGDGVRLSADIFRPVAPGRRFPALIAISPYTRQVQRTIIVNGQNESGITAFGSPAATPTCLSMFGAPTSPTATGTTWARSSAGTSST